MRPQRGGRRLRLPCFVPGQTQNGKVFQARRRIGMVRAQHFLANRQSLLVERLGFGVVADLSGNEPEIIQGFSGLGLLRTSNALGNFNGSFRNRDRLLILTLFNQLIYLLI